MKTEKPKVGKALTWDELADMYPGRARIMPMDTVFEYFERKVGEFWVDPQEGSIHKVLKQ